MTKSPDSGNWAEKAFIAAFFSLVSLVLVNDFYSYYQEITGQFTGRHLRMGLTVFMFGVLIIQKLKVKSLRRQIAK